MTEIIRYSDVFCGAGGMRLAIDEAVKALGCQAECVFSCDKDLYVQQTYSYNFSENPEGDIQSVCLENIPNHDILLAGFPCQPFSSAGKKQGLKDIRSSVIPRLIELIELKKPFMFLLENVTGFRQMENGRIFQDFISSLEKIGYETVWKQINAIYYTPQNRKRIYVIGIYRRIQGTSQIAEKIFDNIPGKRKPVSVRQTFFKWDGAARVKIYQGYVYTLTASIAVSGHIPVIYEKGIFRKLTPKECSFMMGYPDSFHFPVSDAQAYKQVGNSVAVPVVKEILSNIIKYFIDNKNKMLI